MIPIVKADLSKTIEENTKGARDFLGHICMPAAKEFGLLLEDKVRAYRAGNWLKTIQKAAHKYQEYTITGKEHAHPRLLHYAYDNASWTDNDLIQDLWAGLIVSSCTETGDSDSNLWFMKTLSEITASQAKIIKHACENAEKIVLGNGLINTGENLSIQLSQLQTLTGINDVHTLDRELDHLRAIEFFIDGGFSQNSDATDALITPSALCLQFYVRCQGFVGSPVEYFGLTPPTTPSPDKS